MRFISIRKMMAVASVLAVAALMASPAGAQTAMARRAMARANAAANAVAHACAADVSRYCQSVTPGQGRVLFCILAHGDKLSRSCAGTLFEVANDISITVNHIAAAASVCKRDAKRLCGHVRIGQGRVAQCLMSKRKHVSRRCDEALAGLQARLQ